MFKAGWGRMVVGIGLVGVLAHATGGTAAGPTPRQRSLAHFRSVQLAIRKHKQQLRAERLQAARDRAEAERIRVELAKLQAAYDAEGAYRGSRPNACASLGGLFCLTLLSLGTLSDPALFAAHAQPAPAAPPPPAFDAAAAGERYVADATARLDALEPLCAEALLEGHPVPACASAYRAGVLAQVQSIRVQMARLFAPPATLGAGSCQVGEAQHEAKVRIATEQSDILSDFDILTADATVLESQLTRDGYRIEATGAGLLTGQQATLAAAGGATAATEAAFALGQVGESLSAGGFGLQAVGSIFGVIANQAVAARASYQRWANTQSDALLNCTVTTAPAAPGPGSTATDLASPEGAMADALEKMAEGCALAARQALALPVCSEATLEDFGARNSTLSNLYRRSIYCLAGGLLEGRGAPCPSAPLADARHRSDTFTLLDEYYGEVGAASAAAGGFGDGAISAARSLTAAGNAASHAGNQAGGAALYAASSGLIALGTAVFADSFELQRIAALSRRWRAEATKAFNRETRSELTVKAHREPAAGRGSSTGSEVPGAPESSSSGQPEGPDDLPGAVAPAAPSAHSTAPAAPPSSTGSTASSPVSSTGERGLVTWTGILIQEPAPAGTGASTSAAARTRPVAFLELLHYFLVCPERRPEL